MNEWFDVPEVPQTSPERLLRLLVDQMQEYALVLLDARGVIIWWSTGAELIFGIPRADALGSPFYRLFTPADIASGIPDYELTVARVQGTAEDDRWMARPDGSSFWASGVMNGLRAPDGSLLGFGKVLRNRTDLREQLDTLQNQAKASADANYRKDVFLSTLAHELRNPLAPLSNAVELIRLSTSGQPDVEQLLKIIERQIFTLRRLVDDLLDLSRVGAGKIDLKKEAVNIHDVIERAVESARPVVADRRHALDVILPSAPIIVDGDGARLQQVFVNLIHNAAKYTPEGGRIWIKGATEGPEAVVHVEDNGIGIPHEMLPQIFELFTQVESARPHSQGGMGIGLSLVKSLVTLHGGSVQVTSAGDGKGSEFIVRLPLKDSGPD